MANADAFNAGFSLGGKKANGKGKDEKNPKMMGAANPAQPKQFKKGGKVRKTGQALVHKGEVVLTAAQAKKCGHKKSGKKLSSKR